MAKKKLKTTDGWVLNPVRKFKFRTRNYKINWRSIPKKEYAHALTTSPNDPNPEIDIDLRYIDLRTLFRVLYDETLHTSCWDLDNEAVDEMATYGGEFMYQVIFGGKKWIGVDKPTKVCKNKRKSNKGK